MNQDIKQTSQSLKRGRHYVATLASVLILIVLSITGFLNISSFQKSFVDSLVSSYGVAGSEARRTIEYSVKYHKPLNNFAGMSAVLTEITQTVPDISNVYLMLPNGKTLYDISGPTDTQVLSNKLLTKIDFSNGLKKSSPAWVLSDHRYHAFIPLQGAKGDWIGTLDIVFDENNVSKAVSVYLHDALKIMMAIGLSAILLVIFVVYRIQIFDANNQLKKQTFMIVMTLILGLAQASFGVINVVSFRGAYLKVVNNNLNIAADIISKRIDRVVQLGFAYDELDGVDDWLKNLVGSVQEIDVVRLASANGKLLFSSSTADLSENSALASSDKGANLSQQEASIESELPQISRNLSQDARNESAILSVKVSRSYIQQKLFDLTLDAITMFVTSIFFLFEMLVFIIVLLTNRMEKLSLPLASESISKTMLPNKGQNENSVRVLGFLLLLCSYMSISFIPLLMKEIYKPIFGLSANFIIALPIAAEMFGAFIASLLAGYVIDKHGWRPVFVGGFIFLAIATLLSAFSQEPISFIISRFVVGLGYGAAWMGLRGLVAAGNTDKNRSHGFSILNAGIFAGQNCGAVIGALLAQRIGFSTVLILASMMIAIAMPFTFLLTNNSKPAIAGAAVASKGAVRRFFMNKDVFFFFLLVTIPSAITSSFLNYFFPLFANSINISQGNIGRGFLLYGICIVFVGPVLVKILNRLIQREFLILISCFFGAVALAVFWAIPTFVGALFAILILGISDSVGLVSQNNYFISLPSAEALGHGKALSFYSAMKKVGQLAGPAVFGAALSVGAVLGVGLISGGYLATTIAYSVLNRKKTS